MTEEIADTRRLLGASREDSQLACRLIAEAKRRLFESGCDDPQGDGEGERSGGTDRAGESAPHGKLIEMTEPYQIRDWCKSLGCSKQELKRAVARVGPCAERVREFLRPR